jgi:hypothetical protein
MKLWPPKPKHGDMDNIMKHAEVNANAPISIDPADKEQAARIANTVAQV